MKLEKICCPSCGANIDMDIKGRENIFCPFCGSQISIENGNVTITKNININKRYTNDAEVEREKAKDKENERNHKEYKWTMIGLAIFLVLGFCFIGLMGKSEEWKTQKAIDAGMIQIGQSSDDMEGKKYTGVVEKLKTSGFTNITTIDLDDAGLIKNRKDTIESVSINGDTSFYESDYFAPDSKIIVSYH